MKQFIATTFMVLLSANAFAAEGWGVQTRITGYYVWEDGEAYIKTERTTRTWKVARVHTI